LVASHDRYELRAEQINSVYDETVHTYATVKNYEEVYDFARGSSLGLSLAVLACLRHSARLAGQTRLDLPAKGAPEFTNGQWFDGQNFQRRTFYSVDGTLTSKKPLRLDEVTDLKNGYVVPPFGDAHNHDIAGTHDINKILDQYLGDGMLSAVSGDPCRRHSPGVMPK
jgi:hypothetical protein